MAFKQSKALTKEERTARGTLLSGIKQFPSLENKIFQQFLIMLHSRGIISIDEIYETIAHGKKSTLQSLNLRRRADNIYIPSRWSERERKAIQKLVLKTVAMHFSEEEIDDIIKLVVRREEVQNLEDLARLPNVSFDLLAQKVSEFCSLPKPSISLPISDLMATRVCLIHHFISDQLDYLGVAKKYIRIIDLNKAAENSIGPRRGAGRVGGKAAGMILANRIIETEREALQKQLEFRLRFPISYHLRSDLYLDFVKRNDLSHYYDLKYKDVETIQTEYPVIQEIFKNGSFSDDILDELKQLLRKLGKRPLIVRSSSLLEDNFGAAFCGKYRSIYLANQGTEKKRFEQFIGAICAVYASILHPDPLVYRRARNLLDYDEMMAILIQPVVGNYFGDFFFPLFSGVAYSRNEYRWSSRIKKEDGMIRMVMGLGTRAVDRVSSDYPRIIALTEPTLRSQGSVADILKYSQRYLDVINIKQKRFETIPLADLRFDQPMAHLDRVVSVCDEDLLRPVIGKHVDAEATRLCITFDKLISNTSFAEQMHWILKSLETTYGCPVDIEFTSNGEELYLLQCRPMSKQIEWDRVTLPTSIPKERQIFSATKEVRNGKLEDIDYVIYVPATSYDRIDSLKTKERVGRAIGALNQKLHSSTFILMGPGRWGSNDINLGVRITYNDINNTRALIEVAHMKDGYVPEVSFGTHFFQDLVESNIFYLPLYPDEDGNVFNTDFLMKSPNSLREIVPNFSDVEEFVRVIDIRKTKTGQKLHLYMDGEKNAALAFLQD